jgi:hypothetical protein
MNRCQGLPRKRTLAGLSLLTYLLATRPTTLVGFGLLAATQSLLKADAVKGFSFRNLYRSCRSRSASRW